MNAPTFELRIGFSNPGDPTDAVRFPAACVPTRDPFPDLRLTEVPGADRFACSLPQKPWLQS